MNIQNVYKIKKIYLGAAMLLSAAFVLTAQQGVSAANVCTGAVNSTFVTTSVSHDGSQWNVAHSGSGQNDTVTFWGVLEYTGDHDNDPATADVTAPVVEWAALGDGDDLYCVQSSVEVGSSIAVYEQYLDITRGINVDSSGNDKVYGSGNTDEVVYAGDGNDTVYGFHGNDTLDGGEGDDYINGGPGNDTIFGYGGSDTLIGHNGNDFIDGGNGLDVIKGNKGSDTLNGGNDTVADIVQGNAQVDTCFNFGGYDSLHTCENVIQ